MPLPEDEKMLIAVQFSTAAYGLDPTEDPNINGASPAGDAQYAELVNDGWTFLTAADFPNLTVGTMAQNTDGLYLNENAAALVAIKDGTVLISFRGTNDFTTPEQPDVDQWLDLEAHFALLSDFLTEVDSYLTSNNITDVLVTGHSLGGAMAEAYMASPAHSPSDPNATTSFQTINFASPGFTREIGVDQFDDRITSYYTQADIIKGSIILYETYGDQNTFGFINSDDLSAVRPIDRHSLSLYQDIIETLFAAGVQNNQVDNFDGQFFVAGTAAPDANGDFALEVATASVTYDYSTQTEDGGVFFVSGDGADTVTGSVDDDYIFGALGGDTLDGLSGSDTIFGGKGADQLYGGEDADTIEGGSQGDTINAGHGDDSLHGNSGTDELFGGDGNDEMRGGNGTDTLSGNADADSIYGGNGSDILFGGAGDDRLYGNGGSDSISGGDGNDYLNGANGADYLAGELGDDTVVGGSTGDTLFGGNGADRLFAKGGTDSIDGGEGNDLLKGEAGADTLNGGIGADTLFGGSGADEFLFETTDGTDVIKDFETNLDTLVFTTGQFSDVNELMLSASQDGNHVSFDFGNGNTLSVRNIEIDDLVGDIELIFPDVG